MQNDSKPPQLPIRSESHKSEPTSKTVLKNFIVFEGCDGAGTTTQLKLLKEKFYQNQKTLPPLVTTFEPTSGGIGTFIRKVLAGDTSFDKQTLAFLFAADRSEHLFGKGGIVEMADNGVLVVCDRYVLSSLVYQGLECGEGLPSKLNSDFPVPQKLIFFDIPCEDAQKRMNNRERKDIFETLDFQIKVRNRYKMLLDVCRKDGSEVFIIDASKTIKEVQDEVWTIISNFN
ncbi:MAG: dTMP kinase [Termitinemataceae bacterium]|nr:MAG: dTMP kinase [Termitinemataceae bacterium]